MSALHKLTDVTNWAYEAPYDDDTPGDPVWDSADVPPVIEAAAELAAQEARIRQLQALLQKPSRQWSVHAFNFAEGEHFGEGMCECCKNYEHEGHKSNCELAAALKAGQ